MKPLFNRAPLTPNTLTQLPLGSIKPEGWLLEQLRIQADGLSGRLFDVWEDVGENCGWLGGTGDAWERAPYYLDGLIPLAWALDDERLKSIAMRYIEWILGSQREDGWFGPENNDDYWPLMIALKALKQYFEVAGDKRVLVLMDKFFRYEYYNLPKHPLRDWAVARGGENMHVVLWFYNLTGQNYLIELCKRLRAQTLDWSNFFHTFPITQPMSRSLRWERLSEALEEEKDEKLEGEQRPYFRTQYHLSHVVNVAMGLKTPGVINMFSSGFKEQGGFGFGWPKLMKHHGVSYGMFTGDEHLNGASPTQGTELCAVVELMYTLETLIGAGDFKSDTDLADILEKLAYNALPAAFNADMTAHQYVQQANQVKVSREKRSWYNNGDDANLYGFAPNFGCCTANYHQGWPKFVSSLWYATNDGGLSAVSYAPCTVKARLQGVPAKVSVSGNYPFSQDVEIEVTVKQPVEFPLYLRVPAWVTQPMIFLPDGEIMQVRAGETTCIRRKWRTGDRLRLELPTQPRVKHWYHQSISVEYGPLLMALQPDEKWEKLTGGEFPDWAVTAESDWGYAILAEEPKKGVLEPEKARAFGKGEPAAHVLVKAAEITWGMKGASCDGVHFPREVTEDTIRTIKLVPYGATGLRISQFPSGKVKPNAD